MSIDRLRHSLSKITHQLQSQPDAEWRGSLSGKIFSNLEAIAKKLNRPVSIQNQGGPYEVFSLGSDAVTLSKRLVDATVGEDGGTIETYVECWDYKHYPWWRDALHLEGIEGLPVILLDTSVLQLATDAHVLDPKNIFDPPTVTAAYRLNPSGDFEREIAMQQWVKDQIKETLNPLLKPNYEIADYEKRLRLRPLNKEASKSRLEDNQAYVEAKAAIQKVFGELDRRYHDRPH